MRRAQILFCLLPFAAALTSACDKDNATSETPTTSTASVAKAAPDAAAPIASASAMASASAAPSASTAPMSAERKAGLAGMFVRTARQLPLEEAKTAQLDKLLAPFASDDDGAHDAMKKVHEDMLAGVKAGKIDNTKLQADYAQIDKSMTARQDKEASALNDLHKLLDTTQRKALTAKLRDKQKERDAKMAEHKAQMNAKAAVDAGASDWTKKRVEKLTRELDLDADQQKKIEPLVAKDTPKPADMDARMADMKKRMDNLLNAFEKDDFDAKKSAGDMWNAKEMRAEMDKHVQFVQSVLPILKPEQRDKLAATMNRPMMHGGPGAPGGPGGPGGMGGAGGPGGDHGPDRADWGHWGEMEQE